MDPVMGSSGATNSANGSVARRRAKVFITGSTEGLGMMAGALLAREGHAVTLHARNHGRAAQARAELPSAEGIVVGDLSSLSGIRRAADEANSAGPFDAVIHNAGVGYRERRRVVMKDGLEHIFVVNVLAPYMLTALIGRPQRLVYLSSAMHRSGEAKLEDPQWARRRWNGTQAYADSKLFDVVLAFAAARHWPSVLSNALEPGWVPTRMGGPDAPDDLSLAPVTQAWLAVSDDPAATVTGEYFYHKGLREVHPAVRDVAFQERLLQYCAAISGVAWSSAPRQGNRPVEEGDLVIARASSPT